MPVKKPLSDIEIKKIRHELAKRLNRDNDQERN